MATIQQLIYGQTIAKLCQQDSKATKDQIKQQLQLLVNPPISGYMSGVLLIDGELVKFEIIQRGAIFCWLFGKDKYKIVLN